MRFFWRRGTPQTAALWRRKGMLTLITALLLALLLQMTLSYSTVARAAANTTTTRHGHFDVTDPQGSRSNVDVAETTTTTHTEEVVHVTIEVTDTHHHPLENIHETVTDEIQPHGEANVTLAINDQDTAEHTAFVGSTTVHDVFTSPHPAGEPALTHVHTYGLYSTVAQQGMDAHHHLISVARTHSGSLWFHRGVNPALDGDWDQFRDAVQEYRSGYYGLLQSHLQIFGSLVIGVSLASVNWAAWQKAVPHHFEWQTMISLFVIGSVVLFGAGAQGIFNNWKKMRDAQYKAAGLFQSMHYRHGPPPPPPGGTGGYHIELR